MENPIVMNEEKRVIVTNPFMGICGMQVCAIADATDEEILKVCNQENPSGTTNGWSSVVRQVLPDSMFYDEKTLPIVCANDPARKHFIVLC